MSDQLKLYDQISKSYPDITFRPKGENTIQIRCPNCHDVLVSANPNRIFINFVACVGPQSQMGVVCATCKHEMYMEFNEGDTALPLAYYLTGVVGIDPDTELDFTEAVAEIKKANDKLIADLAMGDA